MSEGGAALVSARGLVKRYPRRTGLIRRAWRAVVDDVTFSIPAGTTLALVGESGSGKSTVGLMVLDLVEPSEGSVTFEDRPVRKRRGADWLEMRRKMQVIFQDPYSSLNGRMNIGEILTEGMTLHRLGGSHADRTREAGELLERVGLPADALDRYPHEFSGGQRQRIAIARALSVRPAFIVCDEPTSALDVSVQGQVLNLLRRLQREDGLTYLFITHNLWVVGYMADEVCVMDRGRIVERGTVEQVFDHPTEVYTRRLLSAVPTLDPSTRRTLEAGR